MNRDRLIRVGIGIALGLTAGLVVFRVMTKMDSEYEYGPRQPLIAGLLVGLAVAALLAITSPKKPHPD